jgi:hypothetical protein
MNTPPTWAWAERDVDVTDAWNMIRDPENEIGAVVTACLHVNTYLPSEPADPDERGKPVPVYAIFGVKHETREATTYHDRAWCIANGLSPMMHAVEKRINS